MVKSCRCVQCEILICVASNQNDFQHNRSSESVTDVLTLSYTVSTVQVYKEEYAVSCNYVQNFGKEAYDVFEICYFGNNARRILE